MRAPGRPHLPPKRPIHPDCGRGARDQQQTCRGAHEAEIGPARGPQSGAPPAFHDFSKLIKLFTYTEGGCDLPTPQRRRPSQPVVRSQPQPAQPRKASQANTAAQVTAPHQAPLHPATVLLHADTQGTERCPGQGRCLQRPTMSWGGDMTWRLRRREGPPRGHPAALGLMDRTIT